MTPLPYLKVEWPAPKNVYAYCSTRLGGHSLAPFDSNNLALHVNDDPDAVILNRQNFTKILQLPTEPAWLEQTHSTQCVLVEEDNNRSADASLTRTPSTVLSIMTADCLPILLCNKAGTEVAAIHAGWKGLANGIIENTLAQMQSPREEIMAWCGPAICQNCFEVGEEVLDIYAANYPFSSHYFKKRPHTKTNTTPLKYLANLSAIAEQLLKNEALPQVYQSNLCTFEEESTFYSYRRQQKTGRIASLIWFN